MAEWSIAAVLKTVEGNTSGGSNPSLSATNQSKSAVIHKVTADLLLSHTKTHTNFGLVAKRVSSTIRLNCKKTTRVWNISGQCKNAVVKI